jgi:hypothetical protein
MRTFGTATVSGLHKLLIKFLSQSFGLPSCTIALGNVSGPGPGAYCRSSSGLQGVSYNGTQIIWIEQVRAFGNVAASWSPACRLRSARCCIVEAALLPYCVILKFRAPLAAGKAGGAALVRSARVGSRRGPIRTTSPCRQEAASNGAAHQC